MFHHIHRVHNVQRFYKVSPIPRDVTIPQTEKAFQICYGNLHRPWYISHCARNHCNFLRHRPKGRCSATLPNFKQIQAGLLGAFHFFPSSGISLPTILAGMMVPQHNNPTWSCSIPYQRNAILRQLFYNKIIVNSTGMYSISDYALNEQPFDFDCILKIIWEASNRLCQQRLQLRLASLILPSQSSEVVVDDNYRKNQFHRIQVSKTSAIDSGT